MKILKNKKIKFLVLGIFLLLLLSPIFFLQIVKIDESMETGEELCIRGAFFLPKAYGFSGDFPFEKASPNQSVFTRELCILPNELLEENKEYNLEISLFGLFKKHLTILSVPYPVVEMPSREEYGIREKVEFVLDRNSKLFTYYLSLEEKEIECEKSEVILSCNLVDLNLAQGLQYGLGLKSKYSSEVVQDLGGVIISTPTAVLVEESSIAQGAVFYAEVSEVSFRFNKEISSDLKIIFERNEGEAIPFDFDLNSTGLTLKTREDIGIGSVIKISLSNVNGTDGSFLEQEYVLNFSVLERPPKNWWDYPDEILPAVKSGDDLLVVVSKKYQLPRSYVPSDLVSVSQANIRVSGNIFARSIIIDDLRELGAAALGDGIDLSIISGYRSYDTQGSTYQYWLNANGGNYGVTDQISARPGHSEHQLGTTIDFSTNTAGFVNFNSSPAAAWLENNAYRYGFVMSYPRGSESVTGFTYEGWHYRYIGRENAQRQKASGTIPLQWLMGQ